MPTFYYKAKKGAEVTISGQVTALNLDDAVERISQLGLVPVSVEDRLVKQQAASPKTVRHGKVSAKEAQIFTKQLLNLLKAGISILRALDIITAQTQNNYFKSVIQQIAAGIREGRAFSDCLNEYPQIFSGFYVSLVRVGEEGGSLKDVLANMADYQTNQQEIISKIKSALAYPIFMALVGVGSVIFTLTFVMPRIIGLFSDMKEDLPLPTVILMNVSHFLKGNWYWVILGFVVLGVLLFQFKKSAQGRIILSHLALKLPILSSWTMKVEIGRFARTLELLLRSGIPVLRAIQISTPVVHNILIRDAIAHSHKDLLSGQSLGASFRQSGLIPVMVCDLVVVGEESGSLTEVFHDIADSYEQETKEAIKMITSLMEPLMILIVGSVVGFIVFAMLLPVFQIDILSR